MAEAILFGLAQKMIENLASQIFQEIGSLWGVKGELEKLKDTISTITAVLQDAAEQQSHNNQVKDWLEKLNDAVYDADDLLSEFSTEATRRSMVSGDKAGKEVRTCFSCSNSNPLAFRYKMSRKIKAMKRKLNAIAEDKKNFHLKENNHVEPKVVREPTHSFVSEEEVIGREEEKKTIIELLLDSNVEENVSVIPIVGIGGLGKTTLAQCVYNDEKVKNNFELKMWVCVSDVFELKSIVEKIIISAIGHAPRNLEMDQLQIQLREKIDRKKYLLVLDDIWNEDREKWLNLKKILMGGLKGSKIVITTRSKLVAKITHTDSPCINLKGLSIKQSWFLFEKVAFSKGQVTNNPTLREIGSEIVKICQGVPLAIKSIGHVLYCKETESEWLSVKNNLLENVTLGSDILPILKLSYDHLPSYLKSCFTYCSLFPKDYEIKMETVIQLWIAQGFVQSSNKNQQLEDVGEEYFKDLLWRSFFEEVETHKGLRYKMHDVIHDLAEAVAGEECRLVSFDGKNINEKNRHVSCPFFIDMSFIETLKSSVKSNKIRTFLQTCEMYGSNALDESLLNTLILSFTHLRALDLHKLKITSVPNSIGKLIHLKYLDLSFNRDIETLPDSITTLLNLQVLKLHDCKGLKELPKKFRELVNLKHLYNHGCDNLSHMPCGLGQMTSLQTLPLFLVSTSSHTGGLGELKELNNLRGTLEISHLKWLEEANSESIVSTLREKQHLEKLILKWDYQDQIDNNGDEKLLEDLQPHQNLKYLEVHYYKGVKFSSWISSLINLVDLRIKNCKRCRYLPPLSHLPFLKSLMLDMINDLEYISNNDTSKEVHASFTTLSTAYLPSLKSLTIWHCRNLKGWWGTTGRDLVATTSASTPGHQHDQSHNSLPLFRLLSYLRIYNCPKMTSMPLFPNLEESLYLDTVSSKPLQETMLVPSSSSSLSSSSPLSKLNKMELESIEDIVSLPAEWALYSLKELSIWKCPRLTSMSGAVRNLTSLCKLRIIDCEKFNPLRDMQDDGMEWQCLNCLRELDFRGIPKLKSLPVGLQCISTLKRLTIENCPNLMTLPKLTSLEYLEIADYGRNPTSLLEISCLTSLRTLRIDQFYNLITFPESIRNPISLEELYVSRCPNLKTLPNDGFLKSLQELDIWDCPNLTTLPNDGFLNSLRNLRIAKCPNLTTLPDDGFLNSLRNLRISECPQLKEKYENKIDEDFPNLEVYWGRF